MMFVNITSLATLTTCSFSKMVEENYEIPII